MLWPCCSANFSYWEYIEASYHSDIVQVAVAAVCRVCQYQEWTFSRWLALLEVIRHKWLVCGVGIVITVCPLGASRCWAVSGHDSDSTTGSLMAELYHCCCSVSFSNMSTVIVAVWICELRIHIVISDGCEWPSLNNCENLVCTVAAITLDGGASSSVYCCHPSSGCMYMAPSHWLVFVHGPPMYFSCTQNQCCKLLFFPVWPHQVSSLGSSSDLPVLSVIKCPSLALVLIWPVPGGICWSYYWQWQMAGHSNTLDQRFHPWDFSLVCTPTNVILRLSAAVNMKQAEVHGLRTYTCIHTHRDRRHFYYSQARCWSVLPFDFIKIHENNIGLFVIDT